MEPSEEQDIILELEGHLEDKAADLESQGLDRNVALRIAVQEMGAPEALASGMYKVHSPGVWRDVTLSTIPHFLLAALFALHLWSHYFLVTLLLIGIALVTWRNWRGREPQQMVLLLDGVYTGGPYSFLVVVLDDLGVRRLDPCDHGTPAVQRSPLPVIDWLHPLFNVDRVFASCVRL